MNPSVLLLERLASLINQSLRQDAARHDLLPIQMQALAYLAAANRYSNIPTAVAEYFGTTRGTVSQTLAVLERKGLIRKEADPLHGKRIHLLLTDAGKAVLSASWSARLEAALAGIDAHGDELASMLRMLLTMLQRLNGNHAFGVCRECLHFQRRENETHCGLTNEVLLEEQTGKICREWRTPVQTEPA
ncbi:MAG TPA: MarR family winged helix-turn-helix transcriptional regulator [Accumulibacter sp.]|nr:MarR family winged helix-turn-helix transcriptional regulator [Accumulibacter sp.]HPP47740.1 MarR family winged helix-turn-helix transcriptional regulator [Accumulibacter sp.]